MSNRRRPTGPTIVVAAEVVVACVPTDTSRLAKMFPEVAHLIPEPSIEHTVIKCFSCRQDAWIGPKQLQTLQGAGARGTALCYECIAKRPGLLDGAPVVTLDPNADNIPRRA